MAFGKGKAKAEAPAKPAPSASEDAIGAFPATYDTDALPERRTAALARMMSIVAAIEALAIVCLAMALNALMPLQKIVPMVVSSNPKGDEIIRVNPVSLSSPSVDYVTEVELRKYVRDRYEITGSTSEQQIRWDVGSAVQLISAPNVYKSFQEKATPEMQRLRASNTTRSVRIDSARKLGEHVDPQTGQNVYTWQVAFTTSDVPQTSPMEGQPQGERHRWVSTYDVTYDAKNVKYGDRLNNPFGMTVVSVNDSRED
jgi:type IV secretory pathway component VirB8